MITSTHQSIYLSLQRPPKCPEPWKSLEHAYITALHEIPEQKSREDHQASFWLVARAKHEGSATTVEKAKMNLHGAITDALRVGPGPHTSWSAPGTARAMQGSRGPQPIH